MRLTELTEHLKAAQVIAEEIREQVTKDAKFATDQAPPGNSAPHALWREVLRAEQLSFKLCAAMLDLQELQPLMAVPRGPA